MHSILCYLNIPIVGYITYYWFNEDSKILFWRPFRVYQNIECANRCNIPLVSQIKLEPQLTDHFFRAIHWLGLFSIWWCRQRPLGAFTFPSAMRHMDSQCSLDPLATFTRATAPSPPRKLGSPALVLISDHAVCRIACGLLLGCYYLVIFPHPSWPSAPGL